MNQTVINRMKLLEIVRENLAKHLSDYAESVQDHLKAMVKIAEHNKKVALKNLKQCKAEKIDDLQSFKGALPKPSSYEKEYNRAIRMLELSVEENITVEEDVFNQLVLDEWGWKNNFVGTMALYKSVA